MGVKKIGTKRQAAFNAEGKATKPNNPTQLCT